jgi:hypothetical protein
MIVEKALKELNECGFHIVQINEGEFLVHDTGLFGFVEEEDPFVVDGDGVLEIYDMYLA